MTRKTIMVVDDEPFNLEIVEELLAEKYDIHSVSSGIECLERISSINPDMILLDVGMPEMDGYQVCRVLKEKPPFTNIPIMFVSARGTLEERLEGYQAGGDDYVIKPFEGAELQLKLENLLSSYEKRADLEAQVQQASDIAFNAMANSSEIGNVMQFVEQSSAVNDENELASLLLATLRLFDLNCVVEFSINGQQKHFSHRGVCSPITIELFELLKNKGRIFTFESRVLFNFETVSILVKNMPEHDVDLTGRLRDHLCFIANSAVQSLRFLETSQELATRKAELTSFTQYLHDQFTELVNIINTSHELNEEIFRQLLMEYEIQIPRMGLEDDQEKYIFESLDKAVQDSIAREDKLFDIKAVFADIELQLSEKLK